MQSTMVESIEERRRKNHHEADVVVVGAGIFGCAAAFALARQGRSVLLLERWMKEPDRIVGELLQPGGVAALKQLGLGDCLEGIDAVRVEGYNVIYHGKPVEIPYPGDDSTSIHIKASTVRDEKSGKPEGRAFHHGRFVRKLREACAREPNITIFETTVTATISSTYNPQVLGVEAQTTNPSTGQKEADFFFGHLTIIADGYASIFRKQYIKNKPVVKSKFWALELIDCPLPRPLHGHVILSDISPILLYQIGTHETRALIDIPENLPEASTAAGGVKGYLKTHAMRALPEEVQPSFAKALEECKLPSMPNSFLPPTVQNTPGVAILGDAMNMRHPLTGGGMTVAFTDVVLLSELLEPSKIPQLSDTEAVQKALATFHWRRKSCSSVINVLAMALYSLFAARGFQLKALQRGCFAYFEKGGLCVDEPVGLLGAIIRKPFVLFYHFFSVALLAIWLLIKDIVGGPLGIWKLPFALIQGWRVFWTACIVIFPFMLSEMKP